MFQIAIYGKGGIGKSTISANISYQLSAKGKKVVQIGCDPKHDSTRLLLKGNRQITVLEHMRGKGTDPNAVVSLGSNGVRCIEAGGPEPGIGCAGRGILTAFDFLEANELIPKDTDIVLYDVLGDVVCGGFAVPLRRKYADAVFIVTSGEFMSIYAANNVLKGIRNFDADVPRVCGLILNCRGIKDEVPYVKNFADAVGLPIVAVVPRTEDFRRAESSGITVSEMSPECEASVTISKVADLVSELVDGKVQLHSANPLDEDTMDLVAKGIRVARFSGVSQKPRCLAVSRRDTYRGCGSSLACRICGSIEDADIIIHGPASCGYYFTCFTDKDHIMSGNDFLRNSEDRFFCTDMKDTTSIFGGTELLRKLVKGRVESGSKLMFIITTCVPGIIGDDSQAVANETMKEHPDVKIICAPVDGIMNKSKMAYFIALKSVCKLIDMGVKPDPGYVNILGMPEPYDIENRNADETEEILSALGFRINMNFLLHNKSEDIRNFRRGCINLKYSIGTSLVNISKAMEDYAGVPQYRIPLPHGISECREWITEFSRSNGVPDEKRDNAIARLEKEFAEGMRGKEDVFKGKKVALLTNTRANNMWILDLLDYMGADVACVLCITNSKWLEADDELHIPQKYRIIYDVDQERAKRIVAEEGIQAVFGPERIVCRMPVPHYITSSTMVGVKSQLVFADRFEAMAEVEHI